MTTMPTDRDALNDAFRAAVFRAETRETDPPAVLDALYLRLLQTDYCESLPATVAALGALGLQWTRYYYDGWHVAVGPEGVEAGKWSEGIPLADGQPGTIATALVQSALRVSWADVKMTGHTAG